MTLRAGRDLPPDSSIHGLQNIRLTGMKMINVMGVKILEQVGGDLIMGDTVELVQAGGNWLMTNISGTNENTRRTGKKRKKIWHVLATCLISSTYASSVIKSIKSTYKARQLHTMTLMWKDILHLNTRVGGKWLKEPNWRGTRSSLRPRKCSGIGASGSEREYLPCSGRLRVATTIDPVCGRKRGWE
ncbi:hypothetical protein JB92DRAFT_2824624 [Gautieria morchelliformis]|nr:hypothetical protein JB92DRAFT_2824624 [Gautieria morchelliformis]